MDIDMELAKIIETGGRAHFEKNSAEGIRTGKGLSVGADG
jgi:hypothetical protein